MPEFTDHSTENEYYGRALRVLLKCTDDNFEVKQTGNCYFDLFINNKLITSGDDESIEKRLMVIARERGLLPLSMWE